MNKGLKAVIIIAIVLAVVGGGAFGGIKIYDYIKQKEKENAEYESIAMYLSHAGENPADFYVSRNTKQNIDFTGLTSDKEKAVHLLQVAEYNYINSKYIGKYRSGNTNMMVTVNKTYDMINPASDLCLKSNVKTQMYELFDYDTTFLNAEGELSAMSYDQNVFYMQDFTNEGAESELLALATPTIMNVMNKGNYYLVYDKVYWQVLQYPRYIEETDSFELTNNGAPIITEFETLPNGNINHQLDPQIAFFPFEVTSDAISEEGLSLSYNEGDGVYTLTFSVNIDAVDQDYADAYMYNLLTFNGRMLNYSATLEIWDSGLIKSVDETYAWDVIQEFNFLGQDLKLYMRMPFVSTTYVSYHPEDADVSGKVSLFD